MYPSTCALAPVAACTDIISISTSQELCCSCCVYVLFNSDVFHSNNKLQVDPIYVTIHSSNSRVSVIVNVPIQYVLLQSCVLILNS